MDSFLILLLNLLARYLHIVCTTLLLGGTFFYEMVVPVAISDLKEEQKLLVFARARWVFKWIVWISATFLLATGVVNSFVHWQQYKTQLTAQHETLAQTPGNTTLPPTTDAPATQAMWWWLAHVSTGVLAILIALSLTIGPVPPARPIRWMRLNLIILLLVIFLATVTRQARLQAEDRQTPMSPAVEGHAG
jgi:hypothetical protein